MKNNELPEFELPKVDPEKLKELAADAAKTATDFIKKYPLESVGGALAVGVLIGLFINRK
jgi:ElaB/YqjD/DUF883 family membrane-anchored ribosome-binding protein